jgi:hypothetical protein
VPTFMVPLALSRLTSPIFTVKLKQERPDSALPGAPDRTIRNWR